MELEQIKKLIADRDIRTVRVEFSDIHGVIRGKAVDARRFENVAEEGIHCALPTFGMDLAGNVAEGTGVADEVGYGDMTAIPDLSTFTVVPWEANTAKVSCDLYLNDELLPLGPRSVLKRMVKAYRDLGLRPIIASELEFFLFKPNGNGGWQPYQDKPSMVYTANPMIDPENFLGKVREAMREMEIPNLACAHEFYPAQYEINLLHGEAVAIADLTSTFKQMIKEMAALGGLRATFMAKPANDSGGSGYHMHISMVDPATGVNRFYEANDNLGLSRVCRQFIAGQMAHARGMLALMAPTINSYKRYKRFSFAPYHVVWGLDNRSTLIRIPPERKAGTRIENRAADACANPYLVAAANLAAGLDGIRRQLDAGEPFFGDAYQLPPEAPQAIVPLSLSEALDALEQDKVLLETLGPSFAKCYLAVKRHEIERFRDYVTDWEFNEYSFHL